jgi:hypothetical protein
MNMNIFAQNTSRLSHSLMRIVQIQIFYEVSQHELSNFCTVLHIIISIELLDRKVAAPV